MWVRRMLRKPVVWIALGVIALGLAFGLYWFQPWKLFTNVTVNDALPSISTPTAQSPTVAAPKGSPALTGGLAASPANRLLASGMFVSHEHSTKGEAQLVQLTDGLRQLIFKDLVTSDGPDLHVWLTDQAVDKGEWYTFDDGRHVEIAKLKGNRGNQVYDLPANLDLTGIRSVTIWCERFSVSFGAAELMVTASR